MEQLIKHTMYAKMTKTVSYEFLGTINMLHCILFKSCIVIDCRFSP